LPCDLAQMNADQLGDLTASPIHTVNQQAQQLQFRQLRIEQLTHEMATLTRWRDRCARRHAAVIMSLIQSAKLNGHDPYR